MRLLIVSLLLVCFALATANGELNAGEGYEWAALIEEGVQPLNAVSQAFDEFVLEHGRVYDSDEARAQAFSAFEANYNAALLVEIGSEATPAAPAAPAATATKTQQTTTKPSPPTKGRSVTPRRRVLNGRIPRSRDHGKRVRVAAKKRTRRSRAEAKALAGQAAVAPTAGAGHAGGMAGGAGSKSGKSGGQSGKTGGQAGGAGTKSGKSGGQSGGAGTKSGKSGGQTGGAGTKSGKTGGGSGETGKKSGKTGGDAGTSGTKSGKTGGGRTRVKPGSSDSSLQPTPSPIIATAPAVNLTPEQRQTRSTQFSQNLAQTMSDNFYKPDASGTVGAVSPDSIRQGMLTEGMSVDEVNAAFARVKLMKIVASSPIQNRGDFGITSQAGSCGSCWAHSAIDAIQRVQRDPSSPLFRTSLSTQQVIDCVKSQDSNGCSGGSPMDAFDYFSRNPIALESEYPATGTSGACRTKEFVNTKRPYATGGWEMVIPACHDATGPCSGQIPLEAQLLEYWSSFTTGPPPPVVVYVDAENWNNYKGGIFDITNCKSTTEAGNHLLVITGFNTDPQTGIPYWILQNSWGTDFGMNGRIFLPAYVNACGLANFAVTVLPPNNSGAPAQVKDARKETDQQIKARMAATLAGKR